MKEESYDFSFASVFLFCHQDLSPRGMTSMMINATSATITPTMIVRIKLYMLPRV